MFRLKNLNILGSKAELAALPEGKLLINTINAHSYNTARKDELFAEALTNGDVLIPDGVSIVKACRWIKAKSLPKERIAGWDLFEFEMNKLEECGMWNVGCGMWDVRCGMWDVECGHAAREYFSHRSTLFWNRITKSYKWKGQCQLSALPLCNDPYFFNFNPRCKALRVVA